MMLPWTIAGAGLANARITPQQLQSYYGNALTNYRQAQAGPPQMSGDAITRAAQMNSMTRQVNPFDPNSRVVAANPMIGRAAPVAQQVANYRNADIAGRPITTLAGYMERQGKGPSHQIAQNIARQGLAPVQNYLAPARDWELRNTVRSNVQSGGGIVGLGLRAAPHIMGFAAGGFANPLASLGAAKVGGGNLLKSALSRSISNFASPSGFARQAQSALLRQAQR